MPRAGVDDVDGLPAVLDDGRRGAPGGRGEKLVRHPFGPLGEGLLVLPLGPRTLAVRVRNAVRRAPGVLAEEDDLAPGLLVHLRGEARPAQDRPQGLGLDEAPGARPGHGRLLRRRGRPVLPVAGEIAADLGDESAVAPFEFREHLGGRGDDDPGRSVGRVPFRDVVRQLGVGRPVVAADRVAHLDHGVGIALLRELVHVFEDAVARGLGERAHVEPVEPGIAAAGHPEEDPLPARRGEPVERLVAPGLQGPADPVPAVEEARHVVRPARHVLDPGQGQRLHEGPRLAGDVGDHDRVDGHAGLFPQAPGERGEADELLGMAEAREDPGQRGLEPDRAVPHGRDEGRFLGLAGLAEVRLDRPGLLGVPLEPRPLGMAGRLRGQRDRLPEVSPVVLFDDGLGIGVADVDVRVGQEPDLARDDRLHGELAAPDRAVVEGHFDGDALLFVDRGNEELEGVVAELELEPGPGRVAAGDDRPRGRSEMARLDPDHLEKPALLADEGLLAPGPDVAAEVVAEGHEPVVAPGLFARDLDPERLPGAEMRGGHLEPHEAEELVELVDHDRLEPEGEAVRPRLPPFPARRVGRRPEAQGPFSVDGEVEAVGALAGGVSGQPDEGRRAALPVGRNGLRSPRRRSSSRRRRG